MYTQMWHLGQMKGPESDRYPFVKYTKVATWHLGQMKVSHL